MLYELLTGRLPFRGDNPVQVLYRHVSDQPPRPRDLNPRIPLELEAVILRALAKIPSERFPDARTMRDHLGGKPGLAPLSHPQRQCGHSPNASLGRLCLPVQRLQRPHCGREFRLRATGRRKRRSWLLPVMLAIAAVGHCDRRYSR